MFSINILMQISRYLVSNRIQILANEAGYVTEYKPVYQRNINVYRGISNTLEFRLKNADQKPVAVDDYTIHFAAFDEDHRQVLRYSSNNQRSDIVKLAPTGLFSVTIPGNDLLNINQQYLSYTIVLEDNSGHQSITYTDEWFGAVGTLYVSSEAFPGPAAAKVIEFPLQSIGFDGEWSTDVVDAEPSINGNEALHTAAVYSNGYTGTIEVQATLDNQILGEQNTWTTVGTLTFDGEETQPKPINIKGVFSYIRFVADNDPTDKIKKILVRN
jgi:hypothetical protein